MKLYIVLVYFLLMSSCISETEKLFWIDKNAKGKSDFLFMAESTNVCPITADSIHYYLTNSEIEETRLLESNITISDGLPTPKSPIFKNFGELKHLNDFHLYVIFRDGMDIEGRDYQFMLRTYDKNYKIIDSYILAKWNKRNEEYCFGEINKSLEIKKKCEMNKKDESYRISKSGKFEILNE